MGLPGSQRSNYQCYPYLTSREFAEVCHSLDRKYCQATLGPLRRKWRLHVHTALNVPGEGPWYTTFVQIARPLDDGTAVNDDLAAEMGGISLHDNQDQAMAELEDTDKEVVLRSSSRRPNFHTSHVQYEIHLHPTYRAPCLWFSLHNLPAGESALDIETVFRYLVPEQFKRSLRQAGPIGGISIDHHPVTGVPSFFVHPCALGDAMAGFDCPKEEYLMSEMRSGVARRKWNKSRPTIRQSKEGHVRNNFLGGQ
ncbi:hypothetical protein AAE478_002367 [Parahypoxylon ruwenzoriense]